MQKSDREIMEILEAFDATGVAHSAAPLCRADPKTVRRYALARDLGRPGGPAPRPKLIDPFLDKIEEWVDRSEGKVRADIVHERLAVMEFGGNERTTRRAVAAAKARWRAGHRRTYRELPGGGYGSARHELIIPAWLPGGGPLPGLAVSAIWTSFPGRGRVKSAEEIMNILEAYDLTGSFRDAGELAGCSHHTVARYVRAREEGRLVPGAASPRPGVIDEYLEKLEEIVDRSMGKVRADVAHDKITAMGYTGSERTTRRAVARLKEAWQAGRRRVHRPWTC